MGEKAVHPRENGVSNGRDDLDEEMNEEGNDSDEITVEDVIEFNAINNQLDALNTALDDIEQKNDDIHAQLLQLLESNRQMRKQMQETNQAGQSEKGAAGAQQQ